jgi:uncharacterized protein YjbI with pentapeptide repeats
MIAPKQPVIAGQLDGVLEMIGSAIEIDRALVGDADISADRLDIDGSRLERCNATGARFSSLVATDVECTRLEAAGMQAYKANVLRTVVSDSRLTGVEFAEAHMEDCVFRNVKFDEAGFRFATLTRVRFENCMLRKAQFEGARLSHVTFTGCDLNEAEFVSAQCKQVDIRGEDITTVRGVLGLKGATISSEQLVQLAPLLATDLGFHVED